MLLLDRFGSPICSLWVLESANTSDSLWVTRVHGRARKYINTRIEKIICGCHWIAKRDLIIAGFTLAEISLIRFLKLSFFAIYKLNNKKLYALI